MSTASIENASHFVTSITMSPEQTQGSDMHDEESPEHDQLPSVEEVKTSIAMHQGQTGKHWCWGVAYAVLALAIAASLIAVGIVIGETQKDNEAAFPAAPPAPSMDDTIEDTIVEELAQFIISQEWSTVVDISKSNSPQRQAVRWLATKDVRQTAMADPVEYKERYALMVFYFAMEGENWPHESYFLTKEHHCEWSKEYNDDEDFPVAIGASCDVDKRVSKLYLAEFGMRGSVPPEIALLEKMEWIHLSGNKIIEISSNMGKLSNIQALNLVNNGLSGPIPSWIADLSSLAEINLSNNKFTGSIPDFFQTLSALHTVNMEQNLLSGHIRQLKGLSTTQAILMGNNQLEGQLESDVFLSWKSLQALDLSGNLLSGSLPRELFALSNLGVLDLHDNRFNGKLPDLVSVQSDVRFLALHKNNITGDLMSLSLMEQLEHLDVSQNHFAGSIPTELGGLKNLRYLFLAFNPFQRSTIPKELGKLENLVDLSLQQTNRIETIPSELGSLTKLRLLDLNQNFLTGTLPESIGNIRGLTFFTTKDNQIQGGVPSSYSNLVALDTFIINNNKMNVGNGDAVCSASVQSLTDYVADCSGTFTCECCVCCNDANLAIDHNVCRDQVWYAGLDPVYSPDYQFQREFYAFHSRKVHYPVSDLLADAPVAVAPVSPPSHYTAESSQTHEEIHPDDIPKDLPATAPVSPPSHYTAESSPTHEEFHPFDTPKDTSTSPPAPVGASPASAPIQENVHVSPQSPPVEHPIATPVPPFIPP